MNPSSRFQNKQGITTLNLISQKPLALPLLNLLLKVMSFQAFLKVSYLNTWMSRPKHKRYIR